MIDKPVHHHQQICTLWYGQLLDIIYLSTNSSSRDPVGFALFIQKVYEVLLTAASIVLQQKNKPIEPPRPCIYMYWYTGDHGKLTDRLLTVVKTSHFQIYMMYPFTLSLFQNGFSLYIDCSIMAQWLPNTTSHFVLCQQMGRLTGQVQVYIVHEII